MDAPGGTDSLAARLLEVLAASEAIEVAEGHQARVFRVRRSDGELIAKVIDPSMTEQAELEVRVALVDALADLHPGVCRPLRVGDQQVSEIEVDGAALLLVCLELADGRALDPADPADAFRMGASLRGLHAAMRSLAPVPLPPVHAFRTAAPEVMHGLGAAQLLHGDFNDGNLRLTEDGVVRIFDFDDCGYGPPELDVVNAIYMVLFDALVSGAAERAISFRSGFLAGYRTGDRTAGEIAADRADAGIVDATIDRLLTARVDALAGWLDDLSTAPIGVRTSSLEWQATLRSVVTTYRTMYR